MEETQAIGGFDQISIENNNNENNNNNNNNNQEGILLSQQSQPIIPYAKLIAIDGENKPIYPIEIYDIIEGENSIGRNDENTIHLPNEISVSGYHGEINLLADEDNDNNMIPKIEHISIKDKESTNKTVIERYTNTNTNTNNNNNNKGKMTITDEQQQQQQQQPIRQQLIPYKIFKLKHLDVIEFGICRTKLFFISEGGIPEEIINPLTTEEEQQQQQQDMLGANTQVFSNDDDDDDDATVTSEDMLGGDNHNHNNHNHNHNNKMTVEDESSPYCVQENVQGIQVNNNDDGSIVSVTNNNNNNNNNIDNNIDDDDDDATEVSEEDSNGSPMIGTIDESDIEDKDDVKNSSNDDHTTGKEIVVAVVEEKALEKKENKENDDDVEKKNDVNSNNNNNNNNNDDATSVTDIDNKKGQEIQQIENEDTNNININDNNKINNLGRIVDDSEEDYDEQEQLEEEEKSVISVVLCEDDDNKDTTKGEETLHLNDSDSDTDTDVENNDDNGDRNKDTSDKDKKELIENDIIEEEKEEEGTKELVQGGGGEKEKKEEAEAEVLELASEMLTQPHSESNGKEPNSLQSTIPQFPITKSSSNTEEIDSDIKDAKEDSNSNSNNNDNNNDNDKNKKGNVINNLMNEMETENIVEESFQESVNEIQDEIVQAVVYGLAQESIEVVCHEETLGILQEELLSQPVKGKETEHEAENKNKNENEDEVVMGVEKQKEVENIEVILEGGGKENKIEKEAKAADLEIEKEKEKEVISKAENVEILVCDSKVVENVDETSQKKDNIIKDLRSNSVANASKTTTSTAEVQIQNEIAVTSKSIASTKKKVVNEDILENSIDIDTDDVKILADETVGKQIPEKLLANSGGIVEESKGSTRRSSRTSKTIENEDSKPITSRKRMRSTSDTEGSKSVDRRVSFKNEDSEDKNTEPERSSHRAKKKPKSIGTSNSMARRMALEPPKIMFSGIKPSKEYKKEIKSIGAIEVKDDRIEEATHLICAGDGVPLKRTPKVMQGISVCPYLLNIDWLHKSAEKEIIQNEEDFIVEKEDYHEKLVMGKGENNATYLFDLRNSLALAAGFRTATKKVLSGYKVYITDGMCGISCPTDKEMQGIVQCAGGTYLKKKLPKETEENVIIISSKEAAAKSAKVKNLLDKFSQSGKDIHTTEFLYYTVLMQDLDLSRDILFLKAGSETTNKRKRGKR